MSFVKWLGIIAFAAVIVFSFGSCKKDSLDGTNWETDLQDVKVLLRFNSPDFTISAGGQTLIEGSYYVSGTTVSLSENAAPESVENAVFIGTLSGNVLSLTVENEIIRFTKRHRILG
jgi:hypothetical protein